MSMLLGAETLLALFMFCVKAHMFNIEDCLEIKKKTKKNNKFNKIFFL